MADERLTQDEVAIVLRRAAELDALRSSALDDVLGVPLAALEAGAAEVGLEPASIRQAVAELRAGALEPAVRSGAGRLVASRVVGVDPSGASHAMGRFLRGQLFVKTRDRDGVQLWRPREDLVARFVRVIDLRAAVRLRAVCEVHVRTVACDEGSLVRIEAVLRPGAVRAPRVAAVGGSAAGVGGTALGVVYAVPQLAVAAAAAGAVVAGGGYLAARSSLTASSRKALEALEGFLDDLDRHGADGRVRRRARSVAERVRER